MKCKMAIEDILEMQSSGLLPTPIDIIRLNALGLKFEKAKGKHSFKTLYSLPRVAYVAGDLYFRQPSIGHEIWLDTFLSNVKINDYSHIIIINAFALSRDFEALPDPNQIDSVQSAVEEFMKEKLSKFTMEQIDCAINYVMNGYDETHNEIAAPKMKKDNDDGDEEDWDFCVGVGVLQEGVAVMFGVTLAEMKSMTKDQLEQTIKTAYALHQMPLKDDGNVELQSYYRTLDEIKNRLTAEKGI